MTFRVMSALPPKRTFISVCIDVRYVPITDTGHICSYRSGMELSGRGPRWYLRSFAEIVRSLILAIRRCLDVGIEFPVFIAVMPITRSAQHQQHGLVLRPPNYVTLPRSGGRIGNVRHSLGY